MARLPITTKRREIDVRVVLGQSIFDLHQQMQILLQRECPEVTNFFAEPLVNVVRGEIKWNTRLTGTIKPATEFSSEEWNIALHKLKKNTVLINNLILRLEKSGRGNSSGTETLRSMLITPDLSKSLFQVGDEFVLAQWGCHEFGSDASNSDLFDQIERQPVKPTLVDPTQVDLPQDPLPPLEKNNSSDEVTLALPSSNLQASDQSEKTVKVGESTPIEPFDLGDTIYQVQEEFRWRWLILLLLLLLLLLGLFLKFRHTYGVGNEESIRSEVSKLWIELDTKIQSCLVSENSLTPNNQAPVTNEEFRNRQTENQIKSDAKVNISLAWNNRADLDLIVKQPDGNVVSFKPCEAATCGILDVDANLCDPRHPCNNLSDKPLENISWRDQMAVGTYKIYVRLYSTNGPRNQIKPIPFTIQITKDGKTSSIPGLIRTEDIKCDELCSTKIQLVNEFNIRN
jgi:hypothetical protein